MSNDGSVRVPLNMQTTQSIEVALPNHCIWCDKPVKARGMCWMHYKRAQRSGELAPFEHAPPPVCKSCRAKVSWRGGCCKACYFRVWRQVTPGREAMLARDRERKRNKKATTNR